MKSILVICEGNICRSPMAEGLLNAALPQVAIASAGTGALVGHPADPIAQQLMRVRGIDISSHRALQINRDMCLGSDLILVMDTRQREQLEQTYPQARGRIFRVGEHLQRDIPDPYRKPESAFRDALAMIDDGLHEWLHRIRRI